MNTTRTKDQILAHIARLDARAAEEMKVSRGRFLQNALDILSAQKREALAELARAETVAFLCAPVDSKGTPYRHCHACDGKNTPHVCY